MPLVKEVALEGAVQETYDSKLVRILFSKNSLRITSLEELYIDFYFNKKLTIDDLLQSEPFKEVMDSLVNAFYSKHKNHSRISIEDFLSVAYEKAWKTIIKYNYQSNYWLYHHLKRNIKHGCIDVLRMEGLTKLRTGNKHTLFHESVPLAYREEADSFNLEESLIFRESLHEAVNSLNESEQSIFNLFLNADNVEQVTLNDICTELNLKHPQQARRILDKLRIQLNDSMY